MDEQEVKDLINTYIVTNHNNEITAAVLNPILIAIVEQSNDLIGNLNDLTTPENIDLVTAINSLQEQIDDFEFSGVQVFSGVDDPNTTPPLSFNVADFYKQLDGGGNTIALWQYDGVEWHNVSANAVSTLQQVTDAGATTDNPIVVQSEDETKSISYESDKIVHTGTGGNTKLTFEAPIDEVNLTIPAKSSDDTFAMLSDIAAAIPIATVVVDANIIQHDRLIGLNTVTLAFPFMIQADNQTWTEYDTDIFPDLEYDPLTGTITGFTIAVGKAVYITINEIAYLT